MNKLQVLVVDDEQRILNFLSSKLRASGYEVLTASNGVEALEQMQSQEPDLVVLDILMPEKDGFETLKELRTFSSVPTIILSAKGANADKVKGLHLGVLLRYSVDYFILLPKVEIWRWEYGKQILG